MITNRNFIIFTLIFLIFYCQIYQTTCKSSLPNGGCIHSQKELQMRENNLSKGRMLRRILPDQQNDGYLQKNSENIKNIVEVKEQKNKNKRNLSTFAELEIEQNPQKIRILADYSMSDENGTHFNSIKNGVDIAIQYFSDLIKVYPMISNLVVKDDYSINNGYEGFCSQVSDLNAIPTSHTSIGVEADLLIYVKSVVEPDEQYVAYASSCQWHHDRPTVGYIVFNESYMPASNDEKGFDDHIETVIHELFHVLGFSGQMIDYFRTVDGKRIHPSYNSYVTTKTIRGYSTNLLASPLVKKYNREYFGCSTAEGAQLENQGDSGSLGSHWERIMFMNEMMNPSMIQSDAVTSILTLAFLKDTNWYADINLDMAEGMQWGKNKGCSFLNSCKTSFEEFSTDSSACSFYRFSMGYAGIETFGDDCPVIYEHDDYQCTDTNDTTPEQATTHDVFSLNSKCFEASIRDTSTTATLDQRCYEYECSGNNVIITITKSSVDYTLTCSSNGQVLNAPTGAGLEGTLTCPSDLSLFCKFPKPCEDYCSGKGYCLQQDGQNDCHCIDGYAGDKCEHTCSSGQVYKSGSCQNSCGNDYYRDSASNLCIACSQSCQDGYCNENGCQLCPEGEYSENNQCVSFCASGTFANEATRTCTQCDSKCTNGCIRNSSNCLTIPFLYTDYDQLQQELVKNPTGIIADLNKKEGDDEEQAQLYSFSVAIFVLYFIQTFV